jgi:hypothetical protein
MGSFKKPPLPLFYLSAMYNDENCGKTNSVGVAVAASKSRVKVQVAAVVDDIAAKRPKPMPTNAKKTWVNSQRIQRSHGCSLFQLCG